MDRDAAHWDAVEEATELLHEERYKEALEVLREVVKTDPTNPYAFFFLGQALYEVGEIEPSRDAYRAALNARARSTSARAIAITHVLRKLGAAPGGDPGGHARRSSRRRRTADALYAVGLAYVARGDNGAARRYLEAYLSSKPELETRLEVEAHPRRRWTPARRGAERYCAQFSKRNSARDRARCAAGSERSAFGQSSDAPDASGGDALTGGRVERRRCSRAARAVASRPCGCSDDA